MMKIKDLFKGCNEGFRQSEPTFETRLLYAELASPYDCYSESKFGYLDGAKFVLETYKPLDELERFIEEYKEDNQPLGEYDNAFLLAIKDFIKQEEVKF